MAIDDDNNEADSIAQATAQKLQDGEDTLINVVRSVGEYINDENEKTRAKAISYLTTILAALPPTYLSRQQVQVLCQFFCDRIEDGGSIEGLSKLQSSERFNNDMAQIAVRAIFEHFVDLQSRTQSARYRIFQFLNELMSNHRKAIQAMGDESVVGLTDLFSGEKDPRNLMLVFSMLRVMMVEWDITQHAQTMFDSVYAYFPITFRPPPNDPYGITAQDLKDRLRDCLSSSKILAPYTIPNLLDKLDSTSPVVKRDVLQTLLCCAETYDAQTMSQYSITLWDCLKFEVLSAQEPELADEALIVLRELAICLSNSVNTSTTTSPIAQFLMPISKECIEHLQEPAQRQAKATGDILKALSSANGKTFSIVVKSVFPPLLTVYQSVSEVIKRRALLEISNQLFESSISIFGAWKSALPDTEPGSENPLNVFKEKFLQIYSQAMMSTVKEEVSFRLTAAKGLLLLSKLRLFLDDSEIGLVVQYLNGIVLEEESYGRDDLKRNAMRGLAQISSSKPRLIMDISFPAFMARLPDTGAEADTTNTYQNTLDGLAEISVEKDVFETLIRRLLNKIDVLLQANTGSSLYLSAILSTIYFVLNRSTPTGVNNLEHYYERVVVRLTQKAIDVLATNLPSVLNDEHVLDLLGRVDNLIIRYCPTERHHEVCENVHKLFSDAAGLSNITQNSSNNALARSMILSTWFLAAIPRQTPTPLFEIENVRHILSKVLGLVIGKRTSLAIQQACLHQVALYINKHIATSHLYVADTLISDAFGFLSPNPNRTLLRDSDISWIRVIFAIAKALILRLSPNADDMLSNLVSLLDADQHSVHIGKIASSGFSTVLSADEVLSKVNYAQIRLLAPQRVFHTLIPLISTMFRKSSNSVEKENCLTALSGILSTVPSEIVMPELPTLLPLLLQSLDLSDQSVKVATLETIAVVIAINPSALEESGHVPALVKRLLGTAAIPKSKYRNTVVASVPQARKLAVRCLFLMSAHISGNRSRPNPLLPLKREVLQHLMNVLDDPRRDVRKEAVDARGAWIRGVDDVENEDADSD